MQCCLRRYSIDLHTGNKLLRLLENNIHTLLANAAPILVTALVESIRFSLQSILLLSVYCFVAVHYGFKSAVVLEPIFLSCRSISLQR